MVNLEFLPFLHRLLVLCVSWYRVGPELLEPWHATSQLASFVFLTFYGEAFLLSTDSLTWTWMVSEVSPASRFVTTPQTRCLEGGIFSMAHIEKLNGGWKMERLVSFLKMFGHFPGHTPAVDFGPDQRSSRRRTLAGSTGKPSWRCMAMAYGCSFPGQDAVSFIFASGATWPLPSCGRGCFAVLVSIAVLVCFWINVSAWSRMCNSFAISLRTAISAKIACFLWWTFA